MPLALWTLLWLNLRATARRVGRQARTPKGAVLLSVGLGVVVLWLLPTVLVGRFVPPTDRDVVRVGGPLLILGLCLLNLLSATGERAVSFSPAEVDFLFPGPFTRRQLLTYKLVKTGSVAALSALLFGLVLGRHGGTFAGRVIGSWFTLQFFQLVAMVAALLTASAGRRTIGRRTLGLGVVAVVAVAVGPTAYRYYPAGGMAVAGHVGDAPLGRAVVAPFAVFARAITTDHLATDGLTWDAAAAGIDAVLVAAVFALDADYLEVAAAASARRSARMSRVRQGGIAGMARATSARLHLPPLPWLAGTGPVVWRQLTTVLRTARGLLTVLAVLAVCVGGAVAHVGADSPADPRGRLGRHRRGLPVPRLAVPRQPAPVRLPRRRRPPRRAPVPAPAADGRRRRRAGRADPRPRRRPGPAARRRRRLRPPAGPLAPRRRRLPPPRRRADRRDGKPPLPPLPQPPGQRRRRRHGGPSAASRSSSSSA